MIISKFKRELNGDVSEIRLNTGEKLQNVEYLTDLEEKTVTENGTYTPSTGKVGFSKVVVNVPAPTSGKLYAWSNADNENIPLVYTYTNDPTTRTVSVYVPSATGLTKTTGTYKSSSTIIYDSHYYERYTTGDITF